ncbi:uncharacterized protein TNCV_4402751 [Trichonephila clavipes]|uniref:Mutator-like transposase domain-containing protein n=1 Tax=Trichonephila clavipes TaxID=2585209 RepID=A0A8X6S6C8_TRICX|nr:uncharacterized protein TNCV_4402751 [Trichonephila clavipes]
MRGSVEVREIAVVANATCLAALDRGPRNSSWQRAIYTPVVNGSFEHHTYDSTIWLGFTPIFKENILERKFYGKRFTKLAFSSNNTSASEAKLSTFDSFDVPDPEFHGSTGNRIINFQALMGNISILCSPEYYATGLKLAEDSKEGLCSNLCVACSCGFMTGFTSTPKENEKFSLNTLLVFGLRLIGRGFTAGSSENMEAVGAFRIFERSLIKRDLQYTEYYGDGESKGFLQVKDIYGESSVTKLECIEHMQKRVGSRLRKLKKNAKGLGGKGKFTDKFIDKLQNCYGIVIRSNVGCLEKMQSAVIAAFYHCCSSNQNPMHGQCPTGKDSWCKHKQALCDGKVSITSEMTAGSETDRFGWLHNMRFKSV